jgi:hypothetical protein
LFAGRFGRNLAAIMVRRLALTNVCPERLIFLQYNYLAEKLRDFEAGSAGRL